MSNGMTYGITLRGDAKQLVGEVKGVQSAFDGLSASTQRNQSQAQQLNVAQSATAEHMRRTNSEAVRLNQSTGLLSSGFSALKNAIAGIGLAVLVTGLVTTADKVTNLQARLSLATKSQLEYNVAQSALFDISQRNYAPLEATYSLYSRMAPAMRDLGASQAQTLSMTDLVAKSLRISGAGAAESASTMMQFSQALGSGVLRGDEFNSMMEASPRLMRALADGTNRQIGELRGMAEQGKLTADVVVNSLLSQGEKITAEYGKMPLTVSAAWVKLGNVATQEIGRMNSAIGGTSAIADTLSGLANNFDQVTNAAGALTAGVAAFGALKAGSMVMEHVVALRAQQAAALSVAQAELARANMTYGATAASRAAAASAVAQATANMTLTGSIASATAAMRAFVAANPFLVIAAGIAAAAFAVKSFFDDATKGFDQFQARMRSASAEELRNQRQQLSANIVDMQHSTLKGFYERDIRAAQDQVRMIDGQLARMEQRAAAVKDKPIAPVKNTADTTKQQESEAKRYAAAIQAANDRIAAFEAETSAAGRLTEAEKQLAVFNEQIAAGTTRMTAAHQQDVRAKLESVVASERNRDAMLAEQKAREDAIRKLDSETASLAQKNTSIEQEIASMGKTKSEIDMLQASRYDNETQILREQLATLDAAGACTAETEALREAIKAREQYKKNMTDLSAARTQQAAAEEATRAQVEMWRSIDQVARDTFVNVLEGGRNTATRLKDAFKAGFFDWLYQMTLRPWIFNVSGVAAGSAASGAASAAGMGGGGSGGLGSLLSAGQSLWNAGSGALTNFGGFVSDGVLNAGVSLYNAGAESVGSWMIGNADTIGSLANTAGTAFAYVSAFKAAIDGQWGRALGTAIGTYFGGPIGGTIGNFIGGLLDGGGKHVSGATTLSGQFNAEGFGGNYLTPWYQDGGLFRASGGGVYTNPVSAEQTAAFSAAVEVTKSILDGLTTSAGESARSLDGWSYSFNQAVNDQAQATAVITDMANSMAAHLIPQLTQFQRQGEALADTAVRLRAEFVITDSVLSLVGGTFGAVGLASATARDELVSLMGGIQQMSGTMQSYYANFFTDSERHARDLQALDAQFVSMNLTMPTSAAGFRALVSAQDLSTEAGRQTFAALMSINGAFSALVPTAEAAAQATRDAIKALQDKAAADTSAYRKAADDIRAFAASVRELQRSLWAGAQAPGGVSAAGTRADFVATNAAAAAGDTAAQGRLAGAATAYLDAAKAQAASALDYAREFGFVQSALAETARSVDQAAQSAATLYNLNALIQFTADTTGIPDDLRNLIAAQTSQYAVDVRAALDAATDPALRQVLLDGAGNYTTTVTAALGITDPAARTLALNASGTYLTTVSAALGQTDEASRRLALTAAGNYMATVTAALGTVDPAARTLALNTANTLMATVSAALGEADPAALRLATERVSAYAVTVTAALGTDAATSNLRALLSGSTDAQLTVNGQLVFDPAGSVATTLNTISDTLDSLLSAAIASNTAARDAVVDQSVARLTDEIRTAVGPGFDSSRLTTTRNADTGAASLSYAGQYATLSGSVSGSGVASSISSVSTPAQSAAQATATHNAALLAEFSAAKAASDRARDAMMTAYTAYPNAGIGGARAESPRAGQYALPDFVRVTAAELAELNAGGTKAAYISAFNAKLSAYNAIQVGSPGTELEFAL